jgi:hypothetical protein
MGPFMGVALIFLLTLVCLFCYYLNMEKETKAGTEFADWITASNVYDFYIEHRKPWDPFFTFSDWMQHFGHTVVSKSNSLKHGGNMIETSGSGIPFKQLSVDISPSPEPPSEPLIVGDIAIRPIDGDIILKTYEGFVSLKNPVNTWTRAAFQSGEKLQKLASGTKITLTIE